MKLADIKTPVAAVTGVGPSLTKLLGKLNIFTVGDLISYYPKKFEDRTSVNPIKNFSINPKIHTIAVVKGHQWFGYGNMKTLKIIIDDGTGTAELICFNRPFMEKNFPQNSIICVTGNFFFKYSSIQSNSFEAVKIADSGELLDFLNMPLPDAGVKPVYALTQGITQKQLHKIIDNALAQYGKGIEDEIPEDLIQKRNLLHKKDAVFLIHKPETMSDVNKARSTLAYEELFQFQSTIAKRILRHKGHLPSPEETESLEQATGTLSGLGNDYSPLQKKLLEALPFELTDDQKKVIIQMNEEIDRGYKERNEIIKRDVPVFENPAFTMNRLLQGDVGSGKTLVALFMACRIKDWKGQTAFMAPTEILARQHAETAAKYLAPFGLNVAFLSGNVKSGGRAQVLKALKNGEIDIVVGTHALFSNDVVYKDLELAIIDEQHRFGVMQRQAILAKGRTTENHITFEPHLLMMSATPIPQSLALTVFGDLDISTIKTKPVGRKEITTYLVREGNEKNAYEAVRKELLLGHQAYFVYPAIGDTPQGDSEDDFELVTEGTESSKGLKSAKDNFINLSTNVFPDFKCALVHSKIPEEEQEAALRAFKAGDVQILAATTVIEVGVDNPNATCMVIEGADRFGLSQLHQLRGRVGRGSDQSFCFLIYSEKLTETGKERMKALRQSTDGFYLAEQDLKTRGPGEITGTLQAGALEFSVADLVRDGEILRVAREDAFLNCHK